MALVLRCSTSMGENKDRQKDKKKKTVSTTKREEERGGATAECRGECQSGRVAMVVPEAAEGVLAALRAPEPSTPCAPKT